LSALSKTRKATSHSAKSAKQTNQEDDEMEFEAESEFSIRARRMNVSQVSESIVSVFELTYGDEYRLKKQFNVISVKL
jgi:hypothetical protein